MTEINLQVLKQDESNIIHFYELSGLNLDILILIVETLLRNQAL